MLVIFAASVAWMTPPTTPHPAAPSPLLAFRAIRSEASVQEAASSIFDGGYSAAEASLPWMSAPTAYSLPPEARSMPKPHFARNHDARDDSWTDDADQLSEEARAQPDDSDIGDGDAIPDDPGQSPDLPGRGND